MGLHSVQYTAGQAGEFFRGWWVPFPGLDEPRIMAKQVMCEPSGRIFLAVWAMTTQTRGVELGGCTHVSGDS